MTEDELKEIEAEATENLKHGPPSDFGPEDILVLVAEVRRLRGAIEKYGCHLGADRHPDDDPEPTDCHQRDDWREDIRSRVITRECDCGLEAILYGRPRPVGTVLWTAPPLTEEDKRRIEEQKNAPKPTLQGLSYWLPSK